MGLRAAPGELEAVLQAPLELAAVDESGERIVARLVAHLPGDAPQLRDIVQKHYRPCRLAMLAGERGGAEFNAALSAIATRQHYRAPPERHLDARGQALADGVGERAPVRLVDHADDIAELPSLHLGERLAKELLGGAIGEVDAAVRIGGDEAVAERIERRLRPAAHELGTVRAAADHLDRREQDRARTAVLEQGARELEPRHLAVLVGKLDLVALGGRLAGEPPADVVGDELGVVGRDELGQVPADDLGGWMAEHRREARIDQQDPFAVDQHRLVDGVDEYVEGTLGRGDRARHGKARDFGIEVFLGCPHAATRPPGVDGGSARERQRDERRDFNSGQRILPSPRRRPVHPALLCRYRRPGAPQTSRCEVSMVPPRDGPLVYIPSPPEDTEGLGSDK